MSSEKLRVKREEVMKIFARGENPPKLFTLHSSLFTKYVAKGYCNNKPSPAGEGGIDEPRASQ